MNRPTSRLSYEYTAGIHASSAVDRPRSYYHAITVLPRSLLSLQACSDLVLLDSPSSHPPCASDAMADPVALELASIKDPIVIETLTKDDPLAIKKLRAIASPRDDIDGCTIDVQELERKCPLDQTFASTHLIDRPFGHFGQLESSPLEILQTIFLHLDLQTLTDLRSVNRRAMLAIDSLPTYRELYTHAPELIRVLLSTRLASHFDLSHLCKELRSEDCYFCGDFGAFLVVPGCRRCCWLCLGEAEDILPISRSQAKESFLLANKILPELPAMLSLPGSYGIDAASSNGRVRDGAVYYKRRTWLVNMWAARCAALQTHGCQKVIDCYMDSQRWEWEAAYAQQGANRLSMEPSVMRIPKPPFPSALTSRGVKICDYESRRFMTAIRLPVLDPSTGRLDWGVACVGCIQGLQDRFTNYWELDRADHMQCQRMYTRKGVLEHAKECERAKRLWRKRRPVFRTKHFDTDLLDERGISWMRDQVSAVHVLPPVKI